MKLRSIFRCAMGAALLPLVCACVHELPADITPEPGPEPDATAELRIAHRSDWGQMTHTVATTRAAEPQMRYVVRTYPAGMVQHFNSAPLTEQVVMRPATLEDFTITVPSPDEAVEIWVWADHADSPDAPLHYDAGHFGEISLPQSPYAGCDERRDAFCGGMPLNPADRAVTLTLERPVARYEFVATDLAQFMQNEGVDNLKGYRVEFAYTGYLTLSYNSFTGLNFNATTGVTFAGTLRRLSDGEASLGFDHVFTSRGERAVSVQAYLITPAGVRRAISPVVNVPISPGVNTTVRGAFLSVREQGGIDIDFDFSGDINIII